MLKLCLEIWYDSLEEAACMNTIPMIIAIMTGILYGSVQSIKLSKQEEEESAKQAAGLYIKSIALCLVVYLVVSVAMK